VSGLVRAERRFAARRRADQRRAAVPLLVAAIVTTVLGVVVWVALASPVLQLRSVVVRGLSVNATSRLEEPSLTVRDVLAAARVPLGKSLVQVSPGPIRSRVAALAPVADVRVRRLWPHQLEIDVVERVPVAAVTASSTGAVTLVDGDGVPFAVQSAAPATAKLLELRLPGSITPGDASQAPAVVEARAALTVWRGLPSALRRQVAWVSADSADDVSFGLAGGHTVVWGSAAQRSDKLAVLALLLHTKAHVYDVSTPSIAVTS
jgi:cell division protein FtsQ